MRQTNERRLINGRTYKPLLVIRGGRAFCFCPSSSPPLAEASAASPTGCSTLRRRAWTHPALLQTVKRPGGVVQTQKLSRCQAANDKRHRERVTVSVFAGDALELKTNSDKS